MSARVDPDASPPNPAVETLPSGPSRLSPQAIEQNQCQRIIAAAAKAVAAHGYSEMTVAQIAAYARVSRSTFYANFKNRQDCVLRAHRDIVERFVALLSDACGSQAEWTAKVSASITAGLAYMASQPDEACMLTLDSRTADVPLAHQVAACQERFAAMLGSGREDTGSDRKPPSLTELALVGAISVVVSNRLLAGESATLGELAPELAYLTLVPFVGSKEARRVVAEEVGSPSGSAPKPQCS